MCEETGCETRLSRYNDGDKCSEHQEPVTLFVNRHGGLTKGKPRSRFTVAEELAGANWRHAATPESTDSNTSR